MKENPTSQQHTPTTQSSGGSVGSGGGGGIVTHDDDGDEVRLYYIDTASAVYDIHTADTFILSYHTHIIYTTFISLY